MRRIWVRYDCEISGSTMNYTPWRETRQQLADAGLAPRKALGQNFLTDSRALDVIEAAARDVPTSVILEIGPGPGVLTERLLDCAPAVVAAEIDDRFIQFLSSRFGQREGLMLLNCDAASGDDVMHPSILEAVQNAAAPRSDYQLVANLPYNVGTPLIIALMTLPAARQPVRILAMLQKELAERLLAGPGTKDYGAPAIARLLYGDGKIIRRVPPASFFPPPRVESAVIDIRRTGGAIPGISDPDRTALMRFVRRAFQQRRKTVRDRKSVV